MNQDKYDAEVATGMWAAGKPERDHDKDIMQSMIETGVAERRRSERSYQSRYFTRKKARAAIARAKGDA